MADNKTWLERIRKQLDASHSAAADYWNSLLPEWRGVVLHAASIHNTGTFKPYLANYSWNELYAHIGCRGMTQLRTGIIRARNMLNEFGPLGRSEFTRRTASRQEPSRPNITPGQEMVIASALLVQLEQQLANKQSKREAGQ